MLNRFSAAALAVSTVLSLSFPALAEDPPMRVGRVSYLEGTVSFHGGDEDQWSYATLNYPVVSGNAFWTEPNARSEVQIGSVEIRMDHSTEMEVVEVDNTATRLDVPQGVVNIHFSTPPINGNVEVMTPSGPIELTQPGTYHIDSGAQGAGPAQVTALEGQLEIRGPRSVLEVMPGETATLTGNPPSFALQEGNATDFDNWALAREQREEAHMAAQYVSPHMTGYEDLDTSGQWASDPTYGEVWYPSSVPAGWEPYRYGHWAYIAPWGWTWVDNAAWGFAPFHYGRWAERNERWCWVPGTIVNEPVYAPALVAFVGGADWSVSLSIGNAPAVGWVPLAPEEVYYPTYPASVAYTRNVNITDVNRTVVNNIVINNHPADITHYANRAAATVVPANAFRQGQPVHKVAMQVPGDQLAHAPITREMTHIAPPAPHENARIAEPQQEARAPEPAHEQEQAREARAPEPAHEEATPVLHIDHEEHEPQIVHLTPTEEEKRALPAEGNTHPLHAPGPVIHRPATPEEAQAKVARFTPPAAAHSLPHAEVQHPAQQTRITATREGWQRAPAVHAEPHAPEQRHEEVR